MSETPYSAPEADLTQSPVINDNIAAIIRGQKIMVFSCGAMLLMTILPIIIVPIAGALAPLFSVLTNLTVILSSLVMIVGVAKVKKNLGESTLYIVVNCLLMILPLVNLLIVFNTNRQAMDVLRQSGIEIGLFGAKR